MPFPLWQPIPPTTTVRNLYGTSLLVCTDDPGFGVLLRCGAGLEEGSATMVHATAKHPNALRMLGVDADTQIGAQAQEFFGVRRVHVVAIPHITWKAFGVGLPRRTPIAVVGALATALLVYLSAPSLSPWLAPPVAAIVGLFIWLLLRRRIPTRIGPPEGPPLEISAVVQRATTGLNHRHRSSRSSRTDPLKGFRSPLRLQ